MTPLPPWSPDREPPAPHYRAELAPAARLRADFARNLDVREMRWCPHNVSRLLRLTGERPERVAEMRSLLGDLGLGHCPSANMGGVFDHGECWGRDGHPLMLVAHPYQVHAEQRALLAALARFGGLAVAADDRPGYYGFGTHHVRIEVREVRRPYAKPPSTPKTRRAARDVRRAFEEEFGRGGR